MDEDTQKMLARAIFMDRVRLLSLTPNTHKRFESRLDGFCYEMGHLVGAGLIPKEDVIAVAAERLGIPAVRQGDGDDPEGMWLDVVETNIESGMLTPTRFSFCRECEKQLYCV